MPAMSGCILTLKAEATKPAAANVLEEQGGSTRFCIASIKSGRVKGSIWIPASCCQPSTRPYGGVGGARLRVPRLDSGDHGRSHLLSESQDQCQSGLRGPEGGVEAVGDHVWVVTFMGHDLGYFDDETCRLEPIDNPFGPKVLPMSPE
jgi:putative transposase